MNGVTSTVSTIGINPAGDMTIGNLTVNGTLTANNLSYIPWYVAGRYDGVNMTLLKNKGQYPFTVARVSGQPAGFYQITWSTPHPDGANYVACCSGEGAGWNDLVNGVVAGATPSSTLMSFAFRKLWQNGAANQSEALADCIFTFFVLK